MKVDRVAIRFLRGLVLAVCLAPALLLAQQASPTQSQDVLIKNAVVMTVTHGNIMDFVPNQARKASLDYALSNSFGFGGTNGAIVFKRWSE